MNDEEIRIKCLELAIALQCNIHDAVYYAKQFYDFITGTNDSKIITAARALSEVVNAKK